MLTSGGISVEMYVDKLYGDSLSDEEKQAEIDKIKEMQERDNLQIGDFENEEPIGDSGQEEEANIISTEEIKE